MLVQPVEHPPDAAVHGQQHPVVNPAILILDIGKLGSIGIEGMHRGMHRIVG